MGNGFCYCCSCFNTIEEKYLVMWYYSIWHNAQPWELWLTFPIYLLSYLWWPSLMFIVFVNCTDVYLWANSMSKMKVRVCLFFPLVTWSCLAVWLLSDFCFFFSFCSIISFSASNFRAYLCVYLLYFSPIFLCCLQMKLFTYQEEKWKWNSLQHCLCLFSTYLRKFN